ncbi:hypothetical protein [Streptomyces sp. NPDC000410]
MNNISELNTLDIEDFELEAISAEVAAAAKNCAATGSCCNCSTTPDLSA